MNFVSQVILILAFLIVFVSTGSAMPPTYAEAFRETAGRYRVETKSRYSTTGNPTSQKFTGHGELRVPHRRGRAVLKVKLGDESVVVAGKIQRLKYKRKQSEVRGIVRLHGKGTLRSSIEGLNGLSSNFQVSAFVLRRGIFPFGFIRFDDRTGNVFSCEFEYPRG